MSYINIKNLRKSYEHKTKNSKNRLLVIDDLTLNINKSEFLTIFGPNGCGKTTLLNIICGILNLDSGEITIGGKNPTNSRIGYVFQDYRESLFPWRYNIDNIAFPLELRNIPKKERREAAKKLLKKFNLKISEYSYPYQLSGGQAQLVAILRALISKPDVLIMDEPFNQLDYQTRTLIHDKLLEIWRETKITILFVSHEIDEAILLGDRVLLLSQIPTKIIKIIDSQLPKNRMHNIIQTDQFFRQKIDALNAFETVL